MRMEASRSWRVQRRSGAAGQALALIVPVAKRTSADSPGSGGGGQRDIAERQARICDAAIARIEARAVAPIR